MQDQNEALTQLGLSELSVEQHVQLLRLHEQGSEQWHAMRHLRITASDVPSALGSQGSYSTPSEVVVTEVEPQLVTAAT